MSLGTDTGTNSYSVDIVTDQGVSVKLTAGAIEYLYLIEDIFSFCITGRIVFWDRVGLMERGALNGTETFKVTFGNNNGSGFFRTLDMKVYKFNNIEPLAGKRGTDSNKVDITLVADGFHKLHTNGWNKAWKDTQISTIIRDISKNHLGIDSFLQSELTNETIEHFDTHLRTPSECISWLMNRASGVRTGQPGYLFYQHGRKDRFGYSFTTLESLLSQTTKMLPSGDDDIYGFEQSNAGYINKINDHKLLSADFNALKTLSGGTLLGYDIRRKKLIRRDYSYLDAIDKFTILGRKTLFSSNLKIERLKKQVDGYSDEKMLDNMWYGNWIKEYCNQQLLEIIVQGHEFRHAGGLIRIIWPSVDDKTGILNKQMDGKYLVRSVTHYMSNNVSGGYKQKLVCIKNGYLDSSNKELIKAKKFNI